MNKTLRYISFIIFILIGQVLFASCMSTPKAVVEPTITPIKVDPHLMETVAAIEASRRMTDNPIPTLSFKVSTSTPSIPMDWDEYTSMMADLTNSCLEANKAILPIFSDLGEDPGLLQDEDFLEKYYDALDDYFEFCSNLHVNNPPSGWELVNDYYAISDDEFQAFVNLLRKFPESNNAADVENAFVHYKKGNEYLVFANTEMEKVLNK